MEDIRPAVREFIVENFILGAKAIEFSDADSFMDRHLVDSTGFLELVTFLEEKFSIVIDDQDMVPENIDSLNAIQGFIGRKLGA